ncbi:MAG: Mor transcription activator family protein [Ghiorsea sp.]
MADDFLDDVIQRFRASVSKEALPDAVCQQVEHDVRQYWSGADVYIAKASRSSKKQRDALIYAAYQRGVTKTVLAKQHGLRVRRIEQIVKVYPSR